MCIFDDCGIWAYFFKTRMWRPLQLSIPEVKCSYFRALENDVSCLLSQSWVSLQEGWFGFTLMSEAGNAECEDVISRHWFCFCKTVPLANKKTQQIKHMEHKIQVMAMQKTTSKPFQRRYSECICEMRLESELMEAEIRSKRQSFLVCA